MDARKTFRYFVIYKPFGVLSQFTKEADHHRTLADLHPFPHDVYPVGRLDKDSEGLLIITNDKQLNFKLLDPSNKHRRTYLVQIDGSISPDAILKLERGVQIKHNKKTYITLPAKAQILNEPPTLPEREPPIRFRKNIPTSWISLTLFEGKNRQVRKMCAAVGYPTLRLIRIQIEDLYLNKMLPGAVHEIDRKELYERIFR